jgi:nucleotide-binding universal stress UspA family protein
MIVIATHGRDGLARFRLGSVADKVVRHAECPTLVIGPNVKIELAPYRVQRILAPLDGTELAEKAVPIASWVARAVDAELNLVRVVSVLMPEYELGYSIDVLGEIEQAAREYLAKMVQKLGPSVRTRADVLVGAPDVQLLEHMKQTPADLVILASHGRAGILRTALGSVADRMLHGPAPVLVLRPEQVSSRLLDVALGAAGTQTAA